MQAALNKHRKISKRGLHLIFWLPILSLMFMHAGILPAQSVQHPRLATLVPPGAQSGTTVEVTLTGKDLEEVTSLHFSHLGIKAERVPDPPLDPKKKDKKPPVYPVKFKVAVAANVPAAVYDVWAYGPEGLSNCRAFAVGGRAEVQEKENNNDVGEAQKIDLDTTVNGVISSKTDVDYYAFAGKKDQRVTCVCRAWSLDSKLNSLVQVYDEQGRELGSCHDFLDDSVVDVTLPADGTYLVRLCSFAYLSGGADDFYRLTVTSAPWIEGVFPPVVQAGQTTAVTLFGYNLPQGKALTSERGGSAGLESAVVQVAAPPAKENRDYAATAFPRTFTIDGFEYRLKNGAGLSNAALLAYASQPLILEKEPKDAALESPQALTVPCELCGKIDTFGDRDWYTFPGKKGDVVVVEGVADRQGAPLDLFFQIWQAEPRKLLGEFDSHDQIPPTVGQLWTYTDDPRTRFVVPADGNYLLYVSSRSAATRAGPQYIYRLQLRLEEPDFRLLVVNSDEDAGGLNVNQNGHQFLSVFCYREDGFQGEVLLEAEGLPNGVSMTPQVIGPKATQAGLVLKIAGNAPLTLAQIRIKRTGVVAGKKLVRPANIGTLVWPNPQKNAPALSRLSSEINLAVCKPGLFTLDTPLQEVAVPVGGKVDLKVVVKNRVEKQNGNIAVTRTVGPVLSNGTAMNFPNVNIAANKDDGVLKVQVPANAQTGTFSLVLQARGKFQVTDPKNKKKKDNLDYTATAPPIEFTIFDSVAKLELDKTELSLKPGDTAIVKVKVARLFKYAGEFKGELVPPSGNPGIKGAAFTIAKGAGEANLQIQVPKEAKAGVYKNFFVRVSAKIDNVTLKEEVPLQIALGKLPGKDGADANLKRVPIVAESAAGWKFMSAQAVKGEQWRTLDFDDKLWKEAKTPLGYGEEEIANR